MKDRLDQPWRSMFNDTCFGPWLNLSYVDNEEGLVHYMLQKQFHQKDESYDLPLVYYLNGHSLAFGRQEFCLFTGFRFGIVSFRKWRYGQIPFHDRVFPHKVGQHVKLIDLFQIIEDEEVFIKLSDDDAIRVCLLLTLDVIFMGKDLGSIVDDIFLRMVEDLDEWNAFPWGEHVWRQLYDSIRNVSSKHIPGYREITGVNESKDLPTYSLNGFVAAFKIWIIESSDKSKNWWNKTPGVIPRALAWSKHTSLRQTDYFDQLFAKKLNSPPIKRVIEKCGYRKRRCEDVVRPPYVEKKSKTSEVPSAEELRGRKKIQDPVIAEKLLQVRPWVEDALLGLDANRKGWLRDEHIDLWISYMWHTRPSDMDWSMVSSFFLPLLMKGTMPVWYANKETYPLGWGEVERVFIPINEPELHWSLAEFHIQTGRVTFIDSGPVYENEMRPYYLSVRNCLATRLPELLEQVGVFAQKEIDSNTYKITFNNAKNVPKQGGVFDDCGVWLCIFLFRLGNGKLLDVDNPVQVALAYRERLLRFYYKHKIHVA
ncbi:phospholipase-like protein [Artemisia annua]|uniref:Phospholipase-like protein n=1 Tax=Artemisia annua TaxID=35608 RepID=A0A2U1LKT8_ARTAN|nr:phospholipase-like protein [Artemisia annua]